MASVAYWSDVAWQSADALLFGEDVSTGPFPALRPAKRSYSLGAFAVSNETGYGGNEVKFLHSERVSGLNMQLEYQYLTQAESALIRNHYRSQQGSVIPFVLPIDIWAGHTNISNIVPLGTAWHYVTPPTEEQLSGGYVNTVVSLQTVGAFVTENEPELVFAMAVNTLLVAGGLQETGSSLAISTSVSGGDVITAPFGVTIAMTYAPGAAPANDAAPGSDLAFWADWTWQGDGVLMFDDSSDDVLTLMPWLDWNQDLFCDWQ